MFKSSTLMVTIVITVTMKEAFSYTESCIGEFCFTMPDSSELRNFEDAKSWCTNNNSTLAVVRDSGVQLALAQFLNSLNRNAMTFINMKQFQQGNAWFLVNGATFEGIIGNTGTRTVNYYLGLYCALKAYTGNFQLDASHPYAINRYICEFQGTMCMKNSTNNFLYNGRCYVKYENDALTWFRAREVCYNNGGDLATFQTTTWIPPFGTPQLNASITYWVGIRWSNWQWKSPDGGNETIYTSWSSLKPNNYSIQCVCVDPNGIPVWSWTDCSCDVQRQFVCLKNVPTTTTSITTTKAPITTTTATTAPTINTTSEVTSRFSPNSTTNVIILGLVLGIILPLTIIIIVLTIIIVYLRRKLSNESSSPVANNTSIQPSKRATELHVDVFDPYYQPLQKDSTPTMPRQQYGQLNRSEIREYESVSEMT